MRLVVVSSGLSTPSSSYSGLFKSFFDVIAPDALAGKPVLVAATGGTPRHSLVLEHALRPLFAYLRATVVPTAVYAATSDWGAAGGRDRGPRTGPRGPALRLRLRQDGSPVRSGPKGTSPCSHPWT